MNNKRKTIFIIIGVILVSFLIAGFSYAYISARTEEKNIGGSSGNLDIIYNITGDITGNLIPSSSKEAGLKSTATARLGTNSEEALFNMYIMPSSIEGLNIEALKWEVYGYANGNTTPTYTNSGNFSMASVGTSIKIVDGYSLATSDTTFEVYVWLDNATMPDSVVGKRFAAKITADSVPITGKFD